MKEAIRIIFLNLLLFNQLLIEENFVAVSLTGVCERRKTRRGSKEKLKGRKSNKGKKVKEREEREDERRERKEFRER